MSALHPPRPSADRAAPSMPVRANENDVRSGEQGLVAFLRARRRAWFGESPVDAFRGRWAAPEGSAYEFTAISVRIMRGGTDIEYRSDRASDLSMNYRWAEAAEITALFPEVAASAGFDPAAGRVAMLQMKSGLRETVYIVTRPKKRMVLIANDRWSALFRAG